MRDEAAPPGVERTDGLIEDLVKASVFRGYVEALRQERLLEGVVARLPPRAAALVRQLPPVTAWMPGIDVQHVTDAFADLQGISACRKLGRDSIEHGVGPVSRALTQGMLRLFNPSPATILSRYPMISANFCKGVVFDYVKLGETSCTLEMCIPSRPVSLSSFHATAGAFEHILGICGRTGTVSDPEILPRANGGAARYEIRWTR